MRPEDYENKVRPDRTASYLELNADTPALSSRGRGWAGIVVERDRFLPFDNGEVRYDEHLIGCVLDRDVHLSHSVDGDRHEGLYHPGDLILSPGEQSVHWSLDDPTDALIVSIRPEVIRRAALELTGADPSSVHLVGRSHLRDPLIEQIGLTLLAELEAPTGDDRIYVDSLLNVLTLHLLKHYSTLARKPAEPADRGLPAPKLRRAIEAIRGRLDADISLDELAEAAGLSPSHFAVLFRRSTGLAPHQYLIRCRVERAKELLGRGDLSLAQVAARAGFCDQSHMTRHFKQVVGVTPGQYTKRT